MTLRRWLGLCAMVSLLAACAATAPDGARGELSSAPAAAPVSSPTMQPDDLVDLTVYFRDGEGADAFLVPVTREAPIASDQASEALAVAALRLLIAGPSPDDGVELRPPLPAATQVLDLRIEGDTAHVDLSHEVIGLADEVGRAPEHELLALAAIAGTLTEFPSIDRVQLSVEGRQRGTHTGVDVGAFWGGWGLPEVLVRDDSVLAEPAEGEGVPPLARFTRDPQEIGSAGEDVAVTSVRIRDRTTYLRIVVEVADVADPDAPSVVPPTRVGPAGGDIVLEIDGVAAFDADVARGQRVELEDPSFEGVTVEGTERDGQLRIVVAPSDPRTFWLHQLSNPGRIVLDVRK